MAKRSALNPRRRKRTRSRRRRSVRRPRVTVVRVNPPKRRRRRSSARRKPYIKGRRRVRRWKLNPGAMVLNPGGSIFGTLKRAVPVALATAGGFVATRYGARLALGDRDAGPLGYGVNAAVAVGGYLVLRRFKRDLAGPFLVGGLTAIGLRAFGDFAPETAAAVGVGAIQPYGMSALLPAGLGAIQPYGVSCAAAQ